MDPKRTPSPPSATELARRYQRSAGTGDRLGFDEGAFLEIVAHYRERHMFDEALKVADSGLQHFAYSAELYVAKAGVLAALHVYEYALETLQLAETYRAGLPDICLYRARVLTGLGRHDEAFAQLDRLDDLDDPGLRSRRSVAEAMVFEQMRRYSDMYFFVVQALREDAANAEALDLLWIATELTSRHAETAALCEDLIAADAYASRAWYNLGHARYALGETIAALEAFEYAYLIDPRYEFAYREAGEICYETGQYQRAVDLYEVMLEYVSGDNDVLLRLGQCYLHTGAHTQARLCINRVLTRVPEHDEALYYRGRCYAVEGRWPLAVQTYRHAADLNPRDERYTAALATALERVGDVRGAEAAFAKTCETAPEIATHWLTYVSFLLREGRPLDALRVIGEASDHAYAPELRYATVATYLALGREAQGLRELAEVLPDEFDAHESLYAIAPHLREHDLVQQVVRCFR